MGCQPLLIADRLGHEKIQTTLNTYSHLYPNKQAEVAQQLENLINGTWKSILSGRGAYARGISVRALTPAETFVGME